LSEIQGGEERFLEEVFIRNNFASDLTRIFGIMEFLTESFERFDGILSLFNFKVWLRESAVRAMGLMYEKNSTNIKSKKSSLNRRQ